MTEPRYFMVRMQLSKEGFDEFFKKNVFAVGWSDTNFTEYDEINDLREAVQKKHYDSDTRTLSTISRNLNEVERFKSIRKGDRIIIPYGSNIALAIADNDENYSPADFARDLSNQRKVAYCLSGSGVKTIPRNELSEGLQRRLRVPGMTVANLFEFADELEKVFGEDNYTFSHEMLLREQKDRDSFCMNLRNNIRSGNTNLQTGGIGLEALVCELMECEGYKATVLGKSSFPGKADADIRAIKEDSFMLKQILVQVKHHSGFSGKEGIQQIIDVLKMDEYKDYEGYFITSADINEQTSIFAAENGIEVMNGDALVELIINNLSKLKTETLRLLGISPYPHILN